MGKKRNISFATFNEFGIVLVLAVICMVISAINPVFYSWLNVVNILRTSSYVMIVGTAITFVFISGGLDLSVGSVIGLGGLITAVCMNILNLPIALSVVIGLLIGMTIGLFNGIVIVKFKIPPMIVTLGSMYIARGVMNVITKGKPVFPLPSTFNKLGSGSAFMIPYSVWIALIFAVLAYVILNHTVYGRYLYCVGGNKEAARLSGISSDTMQMSVYLISGFAAALSGIIMTARIASAQISLGNGWEMTVIAAVIIGGTSMFGGAGTILGTAIGSLLLSVITNGIVLMGISAYWQNIVTGAIIILAVGIDHYKRRISGNID